MVKKRGGGSMLRMAVNNATASLRSFGIEKPIVEVNEEKKESYIAIDLRDLGKAIGYLGVTGQGSSGSMLISNVPIPFAILTISSLSRPMRGLKIGRTLA